MTIFSALAVAALGCAWPVPNPAQDCISVTGTAVTRVAPDIVSWSITIWDQGQLADAKARNEEKTQAVLGVIRALGVAPEDVQTSYLAVEQQYNEDMLPRRISIGWVVSRTVTCKQRDIARFDEFIDKLLAMADVDVRYALETSHYLDLRKETRLNALRLAKEKAEAMCAAVGATLGAVTSIQEQQPQPLWSGRPNIGNAIFTEPSPMQAQDTIADKTTMAPGLIEISESVNLSFAISG